VRDAALLPLGLSDNGECAQLMLASIALVYLQGSAVSRVAVLRGSGERAGGRSVEGQSLSRRPIYSPLPRASDKGGYECFVDARLVLPPPWRLVRRWRVCRTRHLTVSIVREYAVDSSAPPRTPTC
jgi:hypothetical protein